MQAIMDRAFNLRRYEQGANRQRARFVVWLLLAIEFVLLVYIFTIPVWYTVNQADPTDRVVLFVAARYRLDALLMVVIPHTLVFVGLTFVRLGRLRQASYIAIAVMYAAGIMPTLLLSDLAFDRVAYPMVAIAITQATFLLTNPAVGVFSAVLCALCLIVDSGNARLLDTAQGVLILASSAFVSYQFWLYATYTRSEGRQEGDVVRAGFADLTTSLARLTRERQSLDVSLKLALEQVQETYPDFQSLAIYLLDANEVQAQLASSLGAERGKNMQRFAVGSLTIIGQAMLKANALVMRNNERETSTMTPAFLSGMQTQATLPLRLGTELLGALDLQSTSLMRLDRNDLVTFQSVADSIALLVESVRQFEFTQKRSIENAKLAEQARNALSEVQRLNKRLIGRAWSDYLKENDELTGVSIDVELGKISDQHGWSEGLQRAVITDRSFISDHIAAVPLRVRGQIIGALEIEFEEGKTLDPEELVFLQEVGERFGLAAENARLIEQSQRTAQRESLINVVSSRLQTSTNVEATLAEAARSLNEFLQADKVVIRLGQPDNEKPSRAIEEAL